jgi:hypothetical protein
LHFLTVNPKDMQDTDAFDLTLTGREEATLKFADAPFDPWRLKRLPRPSRVPPLPTLPRKRGRVGRGLWS